MDISSLQGLYMNTPVTPSQDAGQTSGTNSKSFGSVFDAAMNLVNETNTLQNKAAGEEIRFAMGEASNTHDLAIAQNEANIALQYTVAVRDRIISAYQEIMQMQI